MTTSADPLVSIIIPCYNAERYIGEAIESALGQTYRNIEVIVIDDGSTDGSLNVIRSYGDRIRHETGPNRGGCAARNRGIELSNGEFIQFLDADDLLDPAKLSRQVPVALQNPGAIVFCEGRRIDLRTGRLIWEYAEESVEPDSVALVLRRLVVTHAPLHPKSALLSVGGWTVGLVACQDPELNLRLACAGFRFVILPEILYTWRAVSGSVSGDHVRNVSQYLRFLPPAYEKLRADGTLTDHRARAFAGRMASSARGCLRRGALMAGKRLLVRARQMHPDAGIDLAYGRGSRLLCRLVGPIWTERLAAFKERLWPSRMSIDTNRTSYLQFAANALPQSVRRVLGG